VKRLIDAVSALARMGSSGIFGGQFCPAGLGLEGHARRSTP